MTIVQDVSKASTTDSDKILTFPGGIPGFEKYTKFVLFHKEENDISGYWLESCDKPTVTFTLVDPGQYSLSYELELTDKEKQILQAENADDLGIFLVLSKPEGADIKSTGLNANIAGPIIINTKSRVGLQKVLKKSRVNAMIVQE